MTKPSILAVDDEAFNLDILTEYLEDAGFDVTGAVDGRDGLDKLEAGLRPDVIVLDRMMPRLDGMGVLAHLKADPALCDVPVIMQTAAATHEQVREGIDAGVFYYLTKPYDETVLVSLVNAALTEGRTRARLRAEVREQVRVLGLLRQAQFAFRTLEDASKLAIFISNGFPDPERVVYGLSELMINAVEHGNLGITYEEKSSLMRAGTWHGEVERRLALPEQQDCFATLLFEAGQKEWRVTIKDKGRGFDHQAFLELSPDRATDNHGRGIATAKMISFDSISYSEAGTCVTAAIYQQ